MNGKIEPVTTALSRREAAVKKFEATGDENTVSYQVARDLLYVLIKDFDLLGEVEGEENYVAWYRKAFDAIRAHIEKLESPAPLPPLTPEEREEGGKLLDAAMLNYFGESAVVFTRWEALSQKDRDFASTIFEEITAPFRQANENLHKILGQKRTAIKELRAKIAAQTHPRKSA
jgi:hypothetical protein